MGSKFIWKLVECNLLCRTVKANKRICLQKQTTDDALWEQRVTCALYDLLLAVGWASATGLPMTKLLFPRIHGWPAGVTLRDNSTALANYQSVPLKEKRPSSMIMFPFNRTISVLWNNISYRKLFLVRTFYESDYVIDRDSSTVSTDNILLNCINDCRVQWL